MGTKQAPLPWSVASKRAGGVKSIIIADNPSSTTHMAVVAECAPMSDGAGPLEGENAAFIVRTVNGRDELIAAAADYARITMVEHFPMTDIAVGAAYERLRLALEAIR